MSNYYRFYLNDILLPVNPEELNCKYSNKNKTVQLIDGKEINILKRPGLTEFSFSALIPTFEYPFGLYDGGFKPSSYYIYELKRIKERNKPIYFKVTRRTVNGGIFDTDNFKCTLEDYSYKESAKNGFDIEISIKLKGYVDYGTVKYEMPKQIPGLPDVATQAQKQVERPSDKDVPSATKPQEYVVKRGDTTFSISRKVYGNSNKSSDIARTNKIANPNDLKAGRKLRLG